MKKGPQPPRPKLCDQRCDPEDPRQSDRLRLYATLLKPFLNGMLYIKFGCCVEKKGLQLSVPHLQHGHNVWIWERKHHSSSRLATTSALDQALGSNVQLIQIPHGVGILEHLRNLQAGGNELQHIAIVL